MPDAPSVDLPAQGVASIRVPDLADGEMWLVSLAPPRTGASILCSSGRYEPE
jgi:hypothetical protein